MSSLQPLSYDFISNEYVSSNADETGICALKFRQEAPSGTWIVEHELDFLLFKINAFIDDKLVIPDNISTNGNNIMNIFFSEPVSGFVNILYYSKNAIECIPESIVNENLFTGTNFSSINSYDINGIKELIS